MDVVWLDSDFSELNSVPHSGTLYRNSAYRAVLWLTKHFVPVFRAPFKMMHIIASAVAKSNKFIHNITFLFFEIEHSFS
jgi:hypothetical protein